MNANVKQIDNLTESTESTQGKIEALFRWLGYFQCACFEGSHLVNDVRMSLKEQTNRKNILWYQIDWEYMNCNYIDNYCFKLRFVGGRFAEARDMMSNEWHKDEEIGNFELEYDNIEQAIEVYDKLEEKWAEAGIKLPDMELIVATTTVPYIFGKKSIFPKAFRPD